jgi:hypothetical protein
MFQEKQTHLVWYCTLGVTAAAAMTARALEASDVLSYTAGPVTFRPHLTVAEQYSDNLFFQSNVRADDFITLVRPNMEVWLGRPESPRYARLTYTLDQSFYAQNSDQDSSDHEVALDSTLTFKRLSLENVDRAVFASSIYGGNVSFQQGATTVGATLNRALYDLSHTVSYTLTERTKTYLKGTYHGLDFEKGVTLLDLQRTQGTLGFDFKPLAKTSFFAEGFYSYSSTRANVSTVQTGPDADFYGGFLGARGTFTPRLTGTLKAGYQAGAYRDGTATPDSPVVETSLAYQLAQRTSTSLSYSRQTTLAVQGSKQSVTANWATFRVRQSIGAQQRLAATLALSYGYNEYDNLGTGISYSDNYYGLRFGLDYRLRLWLTASFAYDFEKRDSKLSIDYDVNRVTLALAVGY